MFGGGGEIGLTNADVSGKIKSNGDEMKLYVVRHCTTDCSAEKIYCGRTDVPLNAEGRREAAALTASMRDIPLDLVISSPLQRARETAEAVVGGRKIPILCDERLSERDFGDLEQTSCARPDGLFCRHNFAVKYPNGESNLQVAARIYQFLDSLIADFRDKTLCLVSHGSACRIIRTYFMDMTDGEFYAYSQPNGSVTEYDC